MKNTVFSTLALLFIISATLRSGSQASENDNTSEDCCLSTGDKRIPSNIVKGYKIQLAGNGCRIHAILFLTKHSKHLCAPPDAEWVTALMHKVDMRKKPKAQQKRKRRPQNKRRRRA
ncbi:C-C motif chemokine 19-like [Scyliorhinus canicula]|uniref:C-C motif chemokine 19-like n=1 Tax=Scyliorhinus canicula TaxID=7830 RepID=UPI0018F5D0F4|nr:C-C motif chemokine 19-like [Scyliorhinus canicula]